MSTREIHMKEWRVAARKLWIGQPIVFALGVLTLTTAYAIWLLTIDAERARTNYLLGTLIFSLACARRMIASDRKDQRWIILFQRPVQPLAHYARLVALTLVFVFGLVLLTWGVFATVVVVVDADLHVRSALARSLAWALVLVCTCVGVSSLVRFDVEIVLLLFAISMSFIVFSATHPLPLVVRDGVGYLLMPIETIYLIATSLAPDQPGPAPGDVVRVLLYGLGWLGIAAARVTYLGRGNAPL